MTEPIHNPLYRVNVYIDGFNFYYGLKSKNWKKFYWLDIVKFYELFMKPNQVLNQVYYCTAIPTGLPEQKRQSLLFQANKINPKFNLVYGKFLEKNILINGEKIKTFEEKQTDVNIAVNLLRNVFNNSCDTSIIVSADSDLVPAIQLAKEINPNHKIFCHFPPERHSVQLGNCSDAIIHLHRYESRFKQCVLEETIEIKPGIILSKPPNWKYPPRSQRLSDRIH